jgi:hypothetical protein
MHVLFLPLECGNGQGAELGHRFAAEGGAFNVCADVKCRWPRWTLECKCAAALQRKPSFCLYRHFVVLAMWQAR